MHYIFFLTLTTLNTQISQNTGIYVLNFKTHNRLIISENLKQNLYTKKFLQKH